MATSDKIPLKVVFNAGKSYALSEFQTGDTISPQYTYYDSTGNTQIIGTTVESVLSQVEDGLEFFDQPGGTSKPYFMANMSLTQSPLFSYTYNTLKFDTVQYDTEGNFNPATYEYEIPVKGIWIISGTVTHRVDIQGNIITLMRNGNFYKHMSGKWFATSNSISSSLNQGHIQSGVAIVELDVGDIIKLAYHTGATTDVQVTGTDESSSFSGYLHKVTL